MIHPPHAGATDGAAFRDSHPSQTSPARRWRSDVGDVASPGSLVAALQHAAGGRSCSLKLIPPPSRRVSARSPKPPRSLLQRTLLL